LPLLLLLVVGGGGSRAETDGSRGLAVVLVALASLIIVLVFSRMSYHHLEVMLGRAHWNEPLDLPGGGRRSLRDSPRVAEARAAAAVAAAGDQDDIEMNQAREPQPMPLMPRIPSLDLLPSVEAAAAADRRP
jgi:hypothetical protein